jgi:hypothetical protein
MTVISPIALIWYRMEFALYFSLCRDPDDGCLGISIR